MCDKKMLYSWDLNSLEHKEKLLDNGNTLYYVVRNGTCYQYARKLKDGTYEERDKEDMREVIWSCEFARNYEDRVRIWYGDIITGVSWDDEYFVTGYIGRTTGLYKIPIMLPNKRSSGGPAILTDRIIRIDFTNSHSGPLYKHPKFHVDQMEVRDEENTELRENGYVASVYQENKGCIARFKNRKQAENWVKFMKGERYCK